MLFEDQLVAPVPEDNRRWHGPRGMNGDIIELKEGRLLYTYTRSGWYTNRNTTGLYAQTSDDQGRTWSEEYLLISDPPSPNPGGYCHPSFLRLRNGDILLSYIYRVGGDRPQANNYYRRSTDEGETWSEQFCFTPSPGYILLHNDKLVLLSSGRILAPIAISHNPDYPDHVATAFYSDDNGYSWHMSKNVVNLRPDHVVQEPHVVELKDGRLMMIFRTYSGSVGRAYSDDQGETWSEGELFLPMSPQAGAVTVDRIPSTDDLLLIRATGTDEKERCRTPLVSAISTDEGETWEHERIIAGDPQGDYGYQSVDFLGDLAIISYHQRDGLQVARIGIDWFYASSE